MFVEALHTHDSGLLKLSMRDKLHQPYRKKLVPGLSSIMDNLRHTNGVLGCFLSGAGPAIGVVSCGANIGEVKEIVSSTWSDINVTNQFHSLLLDNEGSKRIL